MLTINGGRPLRGGTYTLTIFSGAGVRGVRDVAGNALDGEFSGTFPSGNGIPGGNFVAELDAIHRRVFAAKSVVGSASPVVLSHSSGSPSRADPRWLRTASAGCDVTSAAGPPVGRSAGVVSDRADRLD